VNNHCEWCDAEIEDRENWLGDLCADCCEIERKQVEADDAREYACMAEIDRRLDEARGK
jgi:hypothetical protein